MVPVLAVLWTVSALCRAQVTTNWDQPAADLSKQVAAITGPGPVKLTLRNQSSLSADELPAIRKLLTLDLRQYGILISGADSATTIRITLSENLAGGLWIAEVQEGADERVVMVPAALQTPADARPASELTLRKSLVWQQTGAVLDAMIVQSGIARTMLILEPDRIVSYTLSANSWIQQQEFPLTHSRPFPRDLRGRILPGQGRLFDAYLPGVQCAGADGGGSLTVSCSESDDPWPLSAGTSTPDPPQKAFYNATRNYFTGVLSPGFSMQLQPFYNGAFIPRPYGTAVLLNGIDGRIILIDNNVVKPIAGVRDWGSDFASIRSDCGSGSQVLVSASGAAPADSVRAYDIPGREAEPVSSALPLDGQVMAIWPSVDGTAATVIVRATAGQMHYEVYNVSAFCS